MDYYELATGGFSISCDLSYNILEASCIDLLAMFDPIFFELNSVPYEPISLPLKGF